jgi:redox-sensing transcriptional repressor
LQHLLRNGQETTSSSDLGDRLGFSDAQVRKDLAYFGTFGHPGIGYRCDELVAAIKGILGTHQDWRIALVGVGNLGRALLGYRGFGNQGFRIAAAFDSDPAKVAQPIDDVPTYLLSDAPRIVAEKEIRLALIAVPAPFAQEVADLLVQAGVHGIVNFAPVTISVPKTVSIVEVDLAIELEQLTFAVVNKPKSG